MTSRAGIDPPMPNHCIRATSIAVLSAARVERCHIKAITGHRGETSIQRYCDKPTFRQFKVMSNTLSDFVEDRDTALAPAQTSAASAPAKKVPLATPSSTSTENIYFNRMSQDGSQHLVTEWFEVAHFTTAVLQYKHAWLKQRLNACSYILFCTSG